MYYCSEITTYNGKRTREPFSALVKDLKELHNLEAYEETKRGYDVEFTTVHVSGICEVLEWIKINKI